MQLGLYLSVKLLVPSLCRSKWTLSAPIEACVRQVGEYWHKFKGNGKVGPREMRLML